jgi:hypothetical protein
MGLMHAKKQLRILRAARELLARRGGWIKGSFVNDERDSYCLVGALNKAAYGSAFVGGGDMLSAARDTGVIAYWRKVYFKPDWLYLDEEIEEWNDRSRTRKREVLALLDGRIAQLEATEGGG